MSVRDWADLKDNRVGPILRELADAIEETDDDETLRKIANRLKFMASSVHSQRYKIRSKLGMPDDDNEG